MHDVSVAVTTSIISPCARSSHSAGVVVAEDVAVIVTVALGVVLSVADTELE